MASLANDADGSRRIQFFLDGRRRTIRLGMVDKKAAEAFKLRIGKLVSAVILNGTPDDETSRWLAGLHNSIYEKLAETGLVSRRERSAVTLDKFIGDYLDSMNVKPATLVFYGHTRRNLTDFFGATKPLRTFQPADGERWRQHLKDSGLSLATVSRRVVVARQFFARAIKWKLMAENPLDGVKTGPQTNKSRQHFVSQDVADAVIDVCPNIRWKLIFALARYGGLRMPSEAVGLEWGDIDWERSRIYIRSPKTEAHEGKEGRHIPLFPKLKPLLLSAFEEAEPGAKHVLSKDRTTSANLRTHMLRILQRAGVKAWPKLFVNLRGSMETELVEQFPAHVAASWLGHSTIVAAKHYLTTQDKNFDAAAGIVSPMAKVVSHIPAQQPSELIGMAAKIASLETKNRPVLPSDSDTFRNVQTNQWARDDSNVRPRPYQRFFLSPKDSEA